jgi:hypothetical protein
MWIFPLSRQRLLRMMGALQTEDRAEKIEDGSASSRGGYLLSSILDLRFRDSVFGSGDRAHGAIGRAILHIHCA